MFEQFNPNLSVYFEEQVSKRLWFLLSLNRLRNVTLNMFDKSMAHKRYISPPPSEYPSRTPRYNSPITSSGGDGTVTCHASQ